MMKPRIVHLLDDQNVGGVRRWIETVSDSRLKEVFEFRLGQSHEILQLLRSRQVSLIICHNPSSWQRSLNLMLIKLYRTKMIILEHHYCEGFERLKVPSLSRFRAMLKWNYGIVDRVVSVSQGQADWIQKCKLVQPARLTTIQISTMLDQFLEIPKKKIQTPFILGAYGRFSDQKGFDVLIKAMQHLSATKVQLYLGGYGEEEVRLKTLAAACPNIKFWGAVHDAAGFVSVCDAIVIPSRWEPGGIVCIEAKAAGKPVIVSDVDGLTEQVQDCGILVTPDDVIQLAAALNLMMTTSADQLESWSQNARTSTQKDWEQHIARWEVLLWQLVSQAH